MRVLDTQSTTSTDSSSNIFHITANVGCVRIDVHFTMEDPFIYHITSEIALEASRETGKLLADSLSTEGFIHSSRASQIPGVIERFYGGATKLVMVEIDWAKLDSELRWDVVYPPETFPHIYGPICTSAIVSTIEGVRDANGVFSFSRPFTGKPEPA